MFAAVQLAGLLWLASLRVEAFACPCCPHCPAGNCPCGCPDCEIDASKYGFPSPDSPTQGPSDPKRSESLHEGEHQESPQQKVKPLLQCPLNCYGDAVTAVALPGSRSAQEGMQVSTRDNCRAYCMAANGCEAVVYGNGFCYGKKDVRISKCLPGSEVFTTDFISQLPFGACTIMGDPHILTFDNPKGLVGDLSQLGAGVYILVKGSGLQIEGRFGFTSRFPTAAALTGIAVKGTLVGGHELVVAYTGPPGLKGFKVTWNGHEILKQGLGDKYQEKYITAQFDVMDTRYFNENAKTSMNESSLGLLPALVIELQPKIRFYLLLGNDTMNAVISMRKLVGSQTGYCGNFDCVASNDCWEELQRTGVASPIEYPKSLFASMPPPPREAMELHGEQPRIQDCSGELMKKAKESCKMLLFVWREECIFDVCAAGSTEVALADEAAIAVGIEVRQKFSWLGPLKIPLLQLRSLSSRMQYAIVLTVTTLATAGVVFGVATRRKRPTPRTPLLVTEEHLVASETVDETDDEKETLLCRRTLA